MKIKHTLLVLCTLDLFIFLRQLNFEFDILVRSGLIIYFGKSWLRFKNAWYELHAFHIFFNLWEFAVMKLSVSEIRELLLEDDNELLI